MHALSFMSPEVFCSSSGWCIVLFSDRLRWTISADVVVSLEDLHYISQIWIKSLKGLRRYTTVLIPFCIRPWTWRLCAAYWKESILSWERSTLSIEHQLFSSLLTSKRRELCTWKQFRCSIEICSKTFKQRTFKRLNKDSIHMSKFCSLRLTVEVYTPAAPEKKCKKTFFKRKFWPKILK